MATGQMWKAPRPIGPFLRAPNSFEKKRGQEEKGSEKKRGQEPISLPKREHQDTKNGS
jgi:hypothetical protein